MRTALAQRLDAVEAAVAESCRRAGRRRAEVTLIAVSKFQPDGAVDDLYALGQRDFGENRVQSLVQRATGSPPDTRWHLIGPVQTNKVKLVVRTPPALLHTIDREALVDAFDRRWPAEAAPLDALIQVNVDLEAQKAGVAPNALEALADRVVASRALTLRGVMVIPRLGTADEARVAFAQTRRFGELIADRVTGSLCVSMGMSADFELAIAEGATHVRVGTRLFGPRHDA